MGIGKKASAVLFIALFLVCCVFAQSVREVTHGEYEGKVIILHSNDVHGALEGYAYMAGLRDRYKNEGAEVILVDDGDFSQGSASVNVFKGKSAVDVMNKVGYDIVGLGNHDFDFGYQNLADNLRDARFKVICSDIFGPDGNTICDSGYVYTTRGGLRIAFFSMDTPETMTKSNPAKLTGLKFATEDRFFEIAGSTVDEYRNNQGCDLVICLTHLGTDSASMPYTSYNLYEKVPGIDFIIDGHSHTVFSSYDGLPIQQTGTKFEEIGVIVIDEASGRIEKSFLLPVEIIPSDEDVAAYVKTIIDKVDAEYEIKFAESTVDLNGDREPGNRTMETNLGDLISDSMMWVITSDASGVKVPQDHLLAINNGGGIRDWIRKGDVTKKDVNNVLPFGNTVYLVYVKGSVILEALEASTFCTPSSIGAFPQVAGMEMTIDTTKKYDAKSEAYPNSTYYGPASINRVTVDSVNGKPFDPEATYGVITNDFVAAGGDTYYAFGSAEDKFDTGFPLDEVLMDYINEVMGGVIDDRYAQPAGRIKIK